MSRREILFTALLGAAAVTHALEAVRGGEGVDFFHYWMVPHLFEAGEGAGVYDADGSGRHRARLADVLRREAPRDIYRDRAASYWDEFQITNTPFCYLVLSPFATRDFATGYFAFQHTSLACLVGGVLVLGRHSGLAWPDGVIAAAAAIFCFECVASDVRVGNVNRILLGWVAVATWAASRVGDRRWGVVAGVLWGLAACFKPIVALICLVVPAYRFAVGERRRAVDEGAGIAIGAAIGLAVPMLVVDGRIWQAWLARLGTFDWSTHSRVAGWNVSLVELVFEKAGFDLALPLGVAILGLVGVTLFVLRDAAARDPASARPAAADASVLVATTSLGLLAYLLAARLVWLHYYVLAIPALLFLAGRIRRGRPVWFVAAATVAGLAIAVKPVLQATAVYDPYLTMGVMVVGGWLAFGLVLRELLIAEAPCGA